MARPLMAVVQATARFSLLTPMAWVIPTCIVLLVARTERIQKADAFYRATHCMEPRLIQCLRLTPMGRVSQICIILLAVPTGLLREPSWFWGATSCMERPF